MVLDAICETAVSGDCDDVGACDSRERQPNAAIARHVVTKQKVASIQRRERRSERWQALGVGPQRKVRKDIARVRMVSSYRAEKKGPRRRGPQTGDQRGWTPQAYKLKLEPHANTQAERLSELNTLLQEIRICCSRARITQ